MKLSKDQISILAKGFCMGCADIVPGVSGGTVALVTGIYDRLIGAISSVNKKFLSLLISMEFKKALEHIDFYFLLPLMIGVFSAIISMAKLMHFLMNEYGVYTWSLFFGLILASIIFVAKQVNNIKKFKQIFFVILGTAIGHAVVTLIPVETPHSFFYVFLAGSIAICAMILPGISGSFILLILGKYLYITSAIKAPLEGDNLLTIITFAAGCLVGLLLFSKLLNYLLKNHHNPLMSILVGFMLGSLQKIWPWKEVLKEKMIRGKTHILEERLVWPSNIGAEETIAFVIMGVGFVLVFMIEKKVNKKALD